MEILDKLSDTIVSVSKDATQKAKDISELARIRMEIRSKKDYVNKLYLEIGRIYYESHKDDVQEFDVDDQMALIKDAQEALEELKKQLGQIKGTVTCKNCGQDMPIEADFCSKCGTKLEKEILEEDTEDAAAEDMPDSESMESDSSAEETKASEAVEDVKTETTEASETVEEVKTETIINLVKEEE